MAVSQSGVAVSQSGVAWCTVSNQTGSNRTSIDVLRYTLAIMAQETNRCYRRRLCPKLLAISKKIV